MLFGMEDSNLLGIELPVPNSLKAVFIMLCNNSIN